MYFQKKIKKSVDKIKNIWYTNWVVKNFEKKLCLGGEIGRRTGLKILWNIIPCRFKSGPRHHNHIYAGVAQLVERQPSKLNVASSTLVSRSKVWAISSVGRALDF